MSNYHIDDIFRENLRDFEVIPSPSIWESMEVPQPVPFYKNLLFITSVVTGIILLVGLGFFLQQNNQISSQTPTEFIPSHEINKAISHVPSHSVQIPFSPDFHLSVYSNSELEEPIPFHSIELATKTDKYHTNIRGRSSSDGESAITHTRSFESTDDVDIPSSFIAFALMKSKPVSTPFNIYLGLPVMGQTSNYTAATPYFNRFGLNSSTPMWSSNTDDLQAIPSLPVNNLDETKLALTIEDKKSTMDSKQEKLMSHYDEKMDMTRGFHIGGFTSAHNNWILNPALKETITPNSSKLIHQLDFGYTYGLAMGYEFSKRWGLQLEWIVNSEQGQRFTKEALYRAAARDSNTDINLTYTYFPVLLKYRSQRMFSLTKQPMVINYIAGIQYGMLKSAEINLENPIVQDDLLQLSSWGFVWGMDYDFYLSKNYFLTFGARTSLSTSSDTRFKPVFPSINTSNSLLIGLRASFNYQFD